MPLSDYQQRVDQFVQSREKPYWSPLSQLGFLIEEVGELSRLLNHLYGDKPKKASETKQELVGELGDVQFAIVCIANREGIDLDQALSLTIDKTKTRDKDRFKKKS